MSPMPDRPSTLVTNTTPLIALTAAMGDLDVLRFLYQRSLEASSSLPEPLLAEVLADMSLASSPPRPKPTTPDASLVSYRLTPGEIALLRQGKKSISDYVQGELPVRLAQLGLAHVLHKP